MMKSHLLVVLCFLVSNSVEEFVIRNPEYTSWGSWGEWEYCPEGEYATGFQLRVEEELGSCGWCDDTALNAVSLFCSKPGSNDEYNSSITSKQGGWGGWRNVYRCHEGLITGFQLLSESPQGIDDDTAANNLRIFCSSSTSVIEGDGLGFGSWTVEQKCSNRQGICGIRTQVEDPEGASDDTGLNNVEMKCCDIQSPGETCSPKDSWEKIVSCSNKGNLGPLTCEYEYMRGISTSSSSSSGGFSEWSTLASVGFSLGTELYGVKGNFETKLAYSKTTGHTWNTESSSTWEESRRFKAKFDVPAGKMATLHQVVGKCGDFMAFTMDFELQECPLNGARVGCKRVKMSTEEVLKYSVPI